MHRIRRPYVVLGCIALAWLCLYLPWFAHETAGFTMHGFDLAEWTSLHPATRSSRPPMLTSFLLRLPHILLPIAAALAAAALPGPRARGAVRMVAALLVLRLLPPIEFFRGAVADPNYRQMMLLTALGLLSVAVMFALPRHMIGAALAIALVVAVATGWWGLSRAGVLLDNFEIDVQVGAGVVGLTAFAVAALVAAGWPGWPVREKTKRRLIRNQSPS